METIKYKYIFKKYPKMNLKIASNLENKLLIFQVALHYG